MHRTSLLSILFAALTMLSAAQDRPNILWLTAEDHDPTLGAYGDEFATTPNLDALARRSVTYNRCWSNAPVCAPARTTIIMGMYATTLGAHHMRSLVSIPENLRMYPQFLREAGYYCTNNSKTDYNVVQPDGVWDESSRNAHWKNRAPGQPFFAIFNDTGTHESRMRNPDYTPRHDVNTVPIPAYHPDAPEVRRDWAEYYDRIEEMDTRMGVLLDELEEADLADDTIVFFYSDHGAGMPRHKRWPYDSGLRVPLIVHVPDKWKHLAPKDYAPGAMSDTLVGFVDLAPTVLNVAGISPPDYMQGRAFMGAEIAQPKQYLFGYRGRMDERYDHVRSVTDGRYIYVRHFWPQRIEGQYMDYMFQTPTTRVWKRLYDEAKLEPHQTQFWTTKPVDELFDLENDPDEIHNLAQDPAHTDKRNELSKALQNIILETRDAGFLPEAEMHERAQGDTVYDMAQNPQRYPLETILAAAEKCTDRSENQERMTEYAKHPDPAVRFWAAVGLLSQGESAYPTAERTILELFQDPAPEVRIVAAESLVRFGDAQYADAALSQLLDYANVLENDLFVSVAAMNAIDYVDDAAKREEYLTAIQNLPRVNPELEGKFRSYIDRLINRTLDDLGVDASAE